MKSTLIKKWILVISITLMIALIPSNEVFINSIKAYTCITIFSVASFAFSLFGNNLIPSLILLFGYRFIAPTTTIMSGWANDTPWSVIGILLIVITMNDTGLMKRFAYSVLSIIGGSYAGICIGMFFVGFAFSFLGDAAIFALLMISYGLVHTMKLEKTKPGIGIMMAAYCGLTDALTFVFNPTGSNWMFGLANAGSDLVPATTNHIEWFHAGSIFLVSYFLLLFSIIYIYKPKKNEKLNGKDYFKNEIKQMGKFTRDESIVAILLMLLLIYLFTTTYHNLPMVLGFIAVPIILTIPGVDILKTEDVKKIDFSIPIFIVSCLAIGSVSNELGVGQILVNLITPYIVTNNMYVLFFSLFIMIFGLNFIMTPGAIYAALITPLTTLSMSTSGVNNVFPLLFMVLIGTFNILLPHEIANTVVFYSLGTMDMKQFIKAFGLRLAIYIPTIFIAISYWKLIGFLN